MRVSEWLWSVPRAAWMLASGQVRLHRDRLGTPLRMSDGRTFTPFRETVRDPVTWLRAMPPAVLQPRFRLRAMGPDARVRHAAFRRACIVTTPFFVALPGFRSKLWMVDAATGEFAGLYEWDDARSAREYAEALCRVLEVLSEPGSVGYELVDGTTVEHYLAVSDHHPTELSA